MIFLPATCCSWCITNIVKALNTSTERQIWKLLSNSSNRIRNFHHQVHRNHHRPNSQDIAKLPVKKARINSVQLNIFAPTQRHTNWIKLTLECTFSQLLICLSFGFEERLRSAEYDAGRFFFPTPAQRLWKNNVSYRNPSNLIESSWCILLHQCNINKWPI